MFLRINFIFCLIFVVHIYSYSQSWKVLHNFSPQQTLHKIRFQNPDYGLAVGTLYNGSTKNIHRTTNGGKTWTDVSSGYTATRFMDIFFLNDSVVYMSGNEGLILRSYNGGLNWETLKTGTKEQLWGLYFTSAKIGYAVGSNGIIIYTTNGGNDWVDVSPGKPNLLYDVTFTKSGIGFASGSNILWRSDDGGSSWNEVQNFPYERPADWIRSIVFVNDNLGFACADIGRIYRTKDGGENWERLNSPTQDPLFEVDFVDEKNGLITGFNGVILRTIDGGDSWEIQPSPLGMENNYSIDFVDLNHAYISTHFGSVLSLNMFINTNNPTAHKSDIELLCNPVTDKIQIINLATEDYEFSIYNLSGMTIMKNKLNEEKTIYCNHIPSGIYTLQLKNRLGENSILFFKQ